MRTYKTLWMALSFTALMAGCSGPPISQETPLGRAEGALNMCERYRSGGARSCLSPGEWQRWAQDRCGAQHAVAGRATVGSPCSPGLYHWAKFICCPAVTLPAAAPSDIPPPPTSSSNGALPFPSASPPPSSGVLPLPSPSAAGSGDIPPPPAAGSGDIPPPPSA